MSNSNTNQDSRPLLDAVSDAHEIRSKAEFNTDQLENLVDSLDDSTLEDEFGDAKWDEITDESERRKPRTVKLRCFNCNRQEDHFLAYRRRWYYSYLIGFSFGLATFIGPYKCRCCGANRMFASNWLHPKTWFAPAEVNKSE